MAYSDPQTITVNAVAQTLNRTGIGVNEGTLATNDGNYKLSVKHTYGKRTRRVIRLDNRKVAADPLATGFNKFYNMSCYLVFDAPDVGYTVAEQKLVSDGFVAFLSASTGAAVTKLLGGEV